MPTCKRDPAFPHWKDTQNDGSFSFNYIENNSKFDIGFEYFTKNYSAVMLNCYKWSLRLCVFTYFTSYATGLYWHFRNLFLPRDLDIDHVQVMMIKLLNSIILTTWKLHRSLQGN